MVFLKGIAFLVMYGQVRRAGGEMGGRGEPGLQSSGCLGVAGRGTRCYWPVVLLSGVLAEPGSRKTRVLG